MPKKKSKLNTDLDDSLKKLSKPTNSDDIMDDPLAGDVPDDVIISEAAEEDDVTYTMGKIQVSDNADNESDDIDLSKAPSQENSDDEDGVEWLDDDVSMKDEDPYLDMEGFDLDNPEDDNYY